MSLLHNYIEQHKYSDVETRQFLLLSRQLELRIARYMAGGVQLKSGPPLSSLKETVSNCENEVKRALDDLWEAMETAE